MMPRLSLLPARASLARLEAFATLYKQPQTSWMASQTTGLSKRLHFEMKPQTGSNRRIQRMFSDKKVVTKETLEEATTDIAQGAITDDDLRSRFQEIESMKPDLSKFEVFNFERLG